MDVLLSGLRYVNKDDDYTKVMYSEEFIDGLSFLFNHYITPQESFHRVHRSQNLHDGYRRQFHKDLESVDRDPDKCTQIFMSGSQFEGMSCGYFERGKGKRHIIDQSDVDVMVVDCTDTVDENELCDTWLAHYKLVFSGYFRSLFYRLEGKNTRLFDRSYQNLHPGFFIIRDKFSGSIVGSKEFHAASMVKDFPSGLSIHGPALSRVNDPQRAIDIDLLYCIKVSDWPREAADWVKRDRPNGWPSSELISTIVKQGCHAVPIGYPQSPTREQEWRISFSDAEMTLSKNLPSHVHRQVYLLFKSICKYRVHEKEIKLASYFLKTILFWSLETSDIRKWDKNHFALAVLELLEKLLLCLNEHYLPNYFIPENNMISHIPEQDIKTLKGKIQEVKRDILNTFICLDEKIGVAGQAVVPLPITRLCSLVVSCLKMPKIEPAAMAQAKVIGLARMAVYWFICSIGCTKINFWDLTTPKAMTLLKDIATKCTSDFIEDLEKARSEEEQTSEFWERFAELVEDIYNDAILDTVRFRSVDKIPLDAILFVICAGKLVKEDTSEVHKMYASILKL